MAILNVRQLGEYLYLDSGTLTPVLKTLEGKGYVQRKRCETDERSVIVAVTEAGMELREKAVTIPPRMGACVNITQEDAVELARILKKIIAGVTNGTDA